MAKQNLRQAIDFLYSRSLATSDSYTRHVLHRVRANDFVQAKILQSHIQLHLFQPKDSFIHNQLLHLFAKCGKLSYARDLFDNMTHRDVYSWNALLFAYAKLGLVEDLCTVFDQMPFRDSVSYNTLIAYFATNGHSGKALKILVRMQEDGFQPTQYSYVNALQACSKLLDLKLGKQIHRRVVISGCRDNTFVWNAITGVYVQCGDIHRARWFFDQMTHKDAVSWNLMISGYVKLGNHDECIRLFNKMKLFGLKPDQVTTSIVINAYFQCGHVDDARRMFSEIPKKDEICWTTMIVGYAQNGREEDAMMLFGNILRGDVRPDSYTISSVGSSCAKLASLCYGQVVLGKVIVMGVDHRMLVSSAPVDMYCNADMVGKGHENFNSISEHGMTPIMDHYACMVTLIGRSSSVDKAVDLIKSMPHVPDYPIWSTPLSICAKKGDIKNAELAAGHFFKLDPHNAGSYIMLSNLYAAYGR
ncbi:hypothetical protein AHAS_Ahas18G0120900 [Arachis hypogaea]